MKNLLLIFQNKGTDPSRCSGGQEYTILCHSDLELASGERSVSDVPVILNGVKNLLLMFLSFGTEGRICFGYFKTRVQILRDAQDDRNILCPVMLTLNLFQRNDLFLMFLSFGSEAEESVPYSHTRNILSLLQYIHMEHNYWAYIMASESGVLYIGVTNNLERRVQEHKNGIVAGFTKKYKCHKLVYFEHFTDIEYAIRREKELKGWIRRKKVNLIESQNPQWNDIFDSIK